MSEDNTNISFEQKLKNEPKLTGKKVRVINPEKPNGADIHAEKHMFEKDFVLKAGEFKDVDETIAKSAAYMWQFLKIVQIPKGEEKKEEVKVDVDDTVTEINSVDDDFEYPTEFDPDNKFLIEKYAYHIQQQIAKEIGIKGYQFMKKDTLHARLLERSIDEIVNGLKKLRLPVHII